MAGSSRGQAVNSSPPRNKRFANTRNKQETPDGQDSLVMVDSSPKGYRSQGES